ncbi:MAG: hypothetical protein AB1648_01165 [Pseudomonadota bacterium]
MPLKNHIEGARALSELGRGARLALGHVQQMPPVCKDIGDYVFRIFGPNRYTVVDRVQRLPERLPMLFASLTA